MDPLGIDKAAQDATAEIATVDVPAAEASLSRLLDRVFLVLAAMMEAAAAAIRAQVGKS